MKKILYIGLLGLVSLNALSSDGTLTIINKTPISIEISGKKQIGVDRPIFQEFGGNKTISPNESFDVGDFAFLTELNVRQKDDKKCYKAVELPTFEDQKGHHGDNLTLTISFKKSGWFSWSGDKFIISYDWHRSSANPSQEDIKKLKRPYWHDITNLKRSAIEQSRAPYVRRAYYFNKNNRNLTHEQLLNQPRQVLFSIHGTFARESTEFYDPDDKVFENVLAYAESLGDSVEVVALQWTGANDANDRVAAGQFLAGLINEHYLDAQKYLSLNTISHSHGGNAVNVATHFISRPLNTIVSLYTPVRNDYEWFIPAPDRFKTLYHFYSTSDSIQFIGAINIFKLNWSNIWGNWGARKALIQTNASQNNSGKIYNIRVEFSGISPAHVNKEAIVSYLPQLIWYINHTYKINYDLDADIDPKNKETLVSIRHSVSPAILNSQDTPPEMKQQAQAESDASRASEVKYLLKYQKEMGTKGWRVINLLRSGKQTILGN